MYFILLSNLPQAIFSLLYLMYNSLYTSMLVADEWRDFARHRKTLRVTSPVGQQRSSYFLQLPYAYAVPLMIFSGLMHWLVSQSLFLASVNAFTPDGVPDKEASIVTCGYSTIAVIFAVIIGSFMVIAVVAVGFRQFEPRMPLASNCSVAISAACHAPPEDTDAAMLPVMWGVIDHIAGEVGHCTFTSQDVRQPVPGQLYA